MKKPFNDNLNQLPLHCLNSIKLRKSTKYRVFRKKVEDILQILRQKINFSSNVLLITRL